MDDLPTEYVIHMYRKESGEVGWYMQEPTPTEHEIMLTYGFTGPYKGKLELMDYTHRMQ